MRTLLDVCGNNPTACAHAEQVIRFCEQYFTYHLVMAKTLFSISVCQGKVENVPNQRGLIDMTSQPYLRFGKEPARADCIEPHQGFSNSLLRLINEICNIRNFAGTGAAHDESLMAVKVSGIETGLDNLRQEVPQSLLAGWKKQQPAEILTIKATAEVHRIGALLFLDETCALYCPEVVPRSREMREILGGRIIELALNIDLDHVTAAYPIWPVFIAGCLVSDEDRRLRILKIFDRIEKIKDFRVSHGLFVILSQQRI